MLELISATEKEAMLSYMIKYGGASNPDFDKIFSVWERNKQWLFHNIFKNRLIISKEVDFTLNYDQSLELFREINKNDDSISRFITLLSSRVDDFENFRILTGNVNLIFNSYLGTRLTIITPDKPIKIQNGTKIMPILRKLSEIYGLENEYEKARILHSIFTERRKTKGTLCLSIHPFDFMSMSDNDCGWDSCMSWREEGDYRIGTTEMMNSPCMVIAYISQDNHFEGGFANKSWRQMFIVNDEVIIEGRPYPYKQEQLTLKTLNWIKDLLGTEGWAKKPLSIQNHTWFDIALEEEEKLGCINIRTNYMYNDYQSTLKTFLILLNYEKFNLGSNYVINISGPAQCMNCGETYGDFRNNSLLCNYCIPYFSCDWCEGESPLEEKTEITLYNGTTMYVCLRCFDNYIYMCECCHTFAFGEDMITLTLDPPNSSFFYKTMICPNCYDKAVSEGIVSENHRNSSSDIPVNYPKLTKEQMARYFGYAEE